ncbi:uncharacterized protein LOC116656226 [Drosophila ananassae]|uniref:uncharacterized protein LOC116656226 n=1 Tax=Drosophila ananassae TaxID=7217 RepID=UPI0013A5DC7E|nr:uncharacterized protein LOC116656226 [Drosophila ananassae]XP_032311589.1 uncharacterized protein LOC116656226 [Drosophila ananassae]XP_032311590.1 uncharacterized protein LOC116656226 [Drosophila ananassae]XP_032311591.1 uncharacterized protein LOC116656226 [Drosophila ananassae]XP_044571552.1 uncharacterized protein LOC116656226 [Drosophila ananassae]
MWLPRCKPLASSINCSNSNRNYNFNCNCLQLSTTIAQHILRWPVILPLAFLMNDSRGKSSYRASKPTSASFDNSQNNNPRTYNNSGKSDKVFLHYTPRDPRLRILNKTATLNKPLNRTLSELNITEDLCNYGELIGGGSADLVQVKTVQVKS